MGTFWTMPAVRQKSYVEWQKWQLAQPLVYVDDDEREIVVPQGFETDGASILRWLWPIFPPMGRYLAAAAVHDHLLATGTRDKADAVFYRALLACRVNWPRARLMWAMVRLYSMVVR